MKSAQPKQNKLRTLSRNLGDHPGLDVVQARLGVHGSAPNLICGIGRWIDK